MLVVLIPLYIPVLIKNFSLNQGGGTHAFNPSSQFRGRQVSEFEASLVYRASSRTARAIEKTTSQVLNKAFFLILSRVVSTGTWDAEAGRPMKVQLCW